MPSLQLSDSTGVSNSIWTAMWRAECLLAAGADKPGAENLSFLTFFAGAVSLKLTEEFLSYRRGRARGGDEEQ